jgi:hypothetical protein
LLLSRGQQLAALSYLCFIFELFIDAHSQGMDLAVRSKLFNQLAMRTVLHDPAMVKYPDKVAGH